MREQADLDHLCAALKRDNLDADLLLRRLVRLARDECSVEALTLWDDLQRIAGDKQ